MSEVHGWAAPEFAEVRAEFEANFARRGEVGAAFCVYRDGEPVVDLWGGMADPRRGVPWAEDTMAIVYSATKAITALCALILVDRGLLSLDAPVTDYWPEFGQAGKERVTVRQVLSHQAGLPAVDAPITIADMERWNTVVDALAAQRPYWEPGTRHGYHAITFGWLVGEIVRRITGQTPAAFMRRHIAEPLGLDLWIGLPESEERRVAPIIPATEVGGGDDPGFQAFVAELMALKPKHGATLARHAQNAFGRVVRGGLRDRADRAIGTAFAKRELSLTQRVFALTIVMPQDMNSRRVHALEMPAGNGIGTARALARMYAAAVGEVDGVRLISPELAAQAAKPETTGLDQVLLSETSFGLGFMVPQSLYFDGWGGPTSFGHTGASGAVGYADPDRRLGVGYILNNQVAEPRNARFDALMRAVSESL